MAKQPKGPVDSYSERFVAVLDAGTVPLEPDEHVVLPRFDDTDYSAPATPSEGGEDA